MAIITPPSLSKLGGVIINGLGDSQTASGGVYQLPGVVPSNVPTWHPSTAYTANMVVKNGSWPYFCKTGGTSAASGGPTGQTSSITDNTVTWSYYFPSINKQGTSFLAWAERFSLGRLNFDLSQAYSGNLAYGLVKIVVTNGGSNYTAPTISWSPTTTGISTTVQTSGGVITGVTVTNPGFLSSIPTATINDASGSGATISLVFNSTGTFGVLGATTADMVARLPDCVASNVDIFTVLGGTNDLTNNKSYATITQNLRACYETLIAAGKKVIAIPILPRTGLTTAQAIVQMRVNHWVRAYCRKEAWANPLGFTNIVLADPTLYISDGTSTSNAPIGGSGGVANNMLYDGLHPAPRGAMYLGMVVWQAAQSFIGTSAMTYARPASCYDGYDANFNPNGNMLEGLPWQASTAYTYIGQRVSNGGNQYRLTGTGTSASSGGPTGTGTGISDGTCNWAYLCPSGLSVFSSGTSGTNTAATGITFTGNLATGYTLSRSAGSASGTITESIENPWSNGQIGQRQSLQFSLGSGTVTENWTLQILNGTYAGYGLQSSDLGNNAFYAECELELSGIANMNQLCLNGPYDSTTSWYNYDGNNTVSAAYHLMSSSGEVLNIPNNGKILLRTQPTIPPTYLTNLQLQLLLSFNASGAAGSATATIKLNYVALRRAAVA